MRSFIGGGIVTSIPTVAYANSVNTQSTPSASSNDTHETARGARSQVQSNHAVNTASKSEKAAISEAADRAATTDPAPAQTGTDSDWFGRAKTLTFPTMVKLLVAEKMFIIQRQIKR